MRDSNHKDGNGVQSGARDTAAHAALHPSVRGARAILFDAGGTLVHPDATRLVSLIAEQTGHRVTTDEMRRALRETLHNADAALACNTNAALARDDADAALAGRAEPPEDTREAGWVFRRTYNAFGFDKATCDRVHARANELHTERHLWCELDPEAQRVLQTLKANGLKIGVISNTEDGRLTELLELVELDSHFDLLIDSHVVGHRKPDAEIFRLALERLGVEPEVAVYVGDLYGHDVLAAERAGMRAILIDPFNLHHDKDCVRISTLGELIEHNRADTAQSNHT